MTGPPATCPTTPRAQVHAWLNHIGADHIVIRDSSGEQSVSAEHTVRRINQLHATHAVIDNFGLRAAILCGDITVAILHTPTYDGTTIRWEKIA